MLLQLLPAHSSVEPRGLALATEPPSTVGSLDHPSQLLTGTRCLLPPPSPQQGRARLWRRHMLVPHPRSPQVTPASTLHPRPIACWPCRTEPPFSDRKPVTDTVQIEFEAVFRVS